MTNNHRQITANKLSVYSEQMKKQNWHRRLVISFNYLRGTLLSSKFSKHAYIEMGDSVRIHKEKQATITLENFVCLSSHVFLDAVSIYPEKHANISIGEASLIGERTELHCNDEIVIGKHVRIGWDCTILDHDYHAMPGEKQEKVLPVFVGDDVWVGCHSIILKGVSIGDGAVIGAGSVVTHNVPSRCFAAGNPAVVKKSWSEAE